MRLNEYFMRISDVDPAAVIEKKTQDFQFANPDKVIVRLDLEDDPLPCPDPCTQAMKSALESISHSLMKLPPRQGYPFLTEAISDFYLKRGVKIADSEIFINDGAKCDITALTDLFSDEDVVLITQPFNPIYYSSNLFSSRPIRFVTAKENEVPMPDGLKADVIYLSNPGNPSGLVYSAEQLSKWVEYALINEALIIFDASYEAFVAEGGVRSIYEIEGAAECAVEICSLSKSAGFANTRLGYTVIPNRVVFGSEKLNRLWSRRQRIRFNGVSNIIQRGACAVFTPEGQSLVRERVKLYTDNVRILKKPLISAGLARDLPVNAPYLWFSCPKNESSWSFFGTVLEKAAMTLIPGSIFGAAGEGKMKLSGYTSRENALLAAERIEKFLKEI
ncbi:MAG: aminotransferase class I/II-fold pyridoxal phosphate-dependent enzyme [Clostridia bacterium]|nr:aminotransferase class I/II-fold pyridoxal phosphate-dependent enzyme [Clostridia bacterium]